jgi:hypothetical protein
VKEYFTLPESLRTDYFINYWHPDPRLEGRVVLNPPVIVVLFEFHI